MIIVIDATNIGGGGGVTHVKEILSVMSFPYPIIIVAQQKILDQIPDHELLTKVGHDLLEKTLFHRVFFQLFIMDKLIPDKAIVFAITGDYLGNHKPVVSMSQNMLLYERDIWKEIRAFREVLRFWINYHKQKRSFKNSKGIIFISEYAKNYISKKISLTGKQLTVIHHGISPRFIKEVKPQKPISDYSVSHPFRFVYVSTVHVYKNQGKVVEAIGILRGMGYPVELTLAGSVIFEPAGKILELTIRNLDPKNEFIHHLGHIPYEEIDKVYHSYDGIIFASTCENMPNILIESMASGIPVASSNKQPMPEFLKEHGYYFDAHQVDSIVSALIEFLNSPQTRELNAKNALKEASKYSWQDTSNKTFDFLSSLFQKN